VEVVIVLPNGGVVSRAADGTLFVTASRRQRAVDPAEPVALLPLPELGPDAVAAETRSAPPLAQIVSLALTWGTKDDWWPRLAVEWLMKTGASEDVHEALTAFAHSDRGS